MITKTKNILNSDSENDEDNQSSTILQITPVKQRVKQICHKMLLDFRCDNGDKCLFDHDPVKLNSEREKIVYNWKTKAERSINNIKDTNSVIQFT